MADLTPSHSQWSEQDGAASAISPEATYAYLAATPNLLQYSQTFANAVWTFGAFGNCTKPTVTDNFSVAPDSTTTAAKIVHSGTNACGLEQRIGCVASTQYTISVYLKARSGSTSLTVALLDDRTGHPSGGTTVATSVVTLTGSWQRVSVTGTTGAGATQVTLSLLNNTDTTQQYDAWGADANLGAAALSYSATTSRANPDPMFGFQTGTSTAVAFEDQGSGTYKINDAATAPVSLLFFNPNVSLNS